MNLRPILFIIFVIGFCCNAAAESLTDSLRVHFRVNQTVIDTLLMGNDAAMHGFADRMHALSSNDSVTVTVNSILITGAASPEGSISLNEYLSRERAATITRWLQGYFEFPDTLPQFVFKGRDWQGLLMAVIGDPDVPNKKEVIDLLIDIKNTDTSSKRDGVARLKALRGGVPYRYLWRKHFPSLRASEVFINATVTPISRIEPEPEIIEVEPIAEVEITEATDSVPTDTLNLSTLKPINLGDAEYGYVFALKTNAIYDIAGLLPNIGAEFPLGKHFSVGAIWMYAWWKNHDSNRHWRIYGGDMNARYYFDRTHHGASLQGHHVGVYAQVFLFQVADGKKGYISGVPGQDIWGKPWYGGGLEYGYSRHIASRLNIDFSLGVGYLTGQYNIYRQIDDCYVWQSTHKRNWIGPTKAEISLVWLIGPMERRLTASEIQKGGAK